MRIIGMFESIIGHARLSEYVEVDTNDETIMHDGK